MADIDPSDPVASYIRPIRSVLFVDDQFPTFGAQGDGDFEEADRARALWRACTSRGWLCDVDNAPEWTDATRRGRLTACDLLVLDLHLMKDDPRPALAIVRELASHPAPNLVVVYTAEEELDLVLLRMAATARGVSVTSMQLDLEAEVDELEVDWSLPDLLAFLEGKGSWRRTFARALREAGIEGGADVTVGAAKVERHLNRVLQIEPRDEPLSVQHVRCGGTTRWFQCGNLFLTVIGKPRAAEGEQAEPDALLGGLEAAIRDWNPPWLACLIASSRKTVSDGAFRDDVLLPPPDLQTGLLRYVRAPADIPERTRRAREVATDLLSRRFSAAADAMARAIELRAQADEERAPSVPELLELNAFLASAEFTRHHLRLGTVFAHGSLVWICVTPACDMAPRKRSVEVDPWAVEMDPLRPFQALRVDVLRSDKQIRGALEEAERGRYVFFRDFRGTPAVARAARCLHPSTGEPNPRLEVLFADERAVVTAGRVRVFRCERGLDGLPAFAAMDCEVVSQLRAPYAERLGHTVGHHLSRIGVNFLRRPPEDDAGGD